MMKVPCILASSSVLAMFMISVAACSREKTDISGRYLQEAYFRYEDRIVPIYKTGTAQQVEKELVALLSIIDEYQTKDPRLYQYDWRRGLTQARLALLYRHLGETSKAQQFMSLSVASFKRYFRAKLNTKVTESQITESWVTNIIEKLDASINPRWKNVPGSGVILVATNQLPDE